ncbi:AAA-type ATPase lid domain-containing protein, partial [Acidiphilium iwatense]|nr:hypothetical protein [Acidiphilium iwatense]
GVALTMPPLRARADRAALIEQLCREESNDAAITIDQDAWAILLAHDWPGNIRELRNALRTAIAFAEDGRIGPAHLPHVIARGPTVFAKSRDRNALCGKIGTDNLTVECRLEDRRAVGPADPA